MTHYIQLREIDQRYKVVETCESVANKVADKTKELVNPIEVYI